MSGWVHKCQNDVRALIRHGDMSGMVEFSTETDTVEVPGDDLKQIVADWVRQQRFYRAEATIDKMSCDELFGLD